MTLLYPWNLSRWDGRDIIQQTIREEGSIKTRWTSGRKNVSAGDRVFLIRLGDPTKKGIVGSGWITGPSFVNDGQWVNPMELDVLQDIDAGEPYIGIDELKKLGKMHWSPQRGGAEIPEVIATQLELLWSQITGAELSSKELNSIISGAEGGRQSVTVTRIERDPRNRDACLKHYGRKCRVCDFDFGKTFGKDADGYIHVHHHNPLADTGKVPVNPITDMSPLCPNCHAVAHLKRPPFSIDELKGMRAVSEDKS